MAIDQGQFERNWELAFGKEKNVLTPLEHAGIGPGDINELIALGKKQDVKPLVTEDGREYFKLKVTDQDGDEVVIHVPLDGSNEDPITKSLLWKEETYRDHCEQFA